MKLNFTDEELKMLADLGVSQEQIEQLQLQEKRGYNLINGQPPLQGRQAGNVYTQPSVTEALGQIGTTLAGAYAARKARKDMKPIMDRQTEERAKVMQAIRDSIAQQKASAAAPAPTSGYMPSGQEIQTKYLRRMQPGGSYSA